VEISPALAHLKGLALAGRARTSEDVTAAAKMASLQWASLSFM
jgi:hypothetical protein